MPSPYHTLTYLSRVRWTALHRQIELVCATGAARVLQAGGGAGVVRGVLEGMGKEVKTLDLDASLNPDYVGDVRTMDARVPPASFDCILAAQILEHLPWADIPATLAAMRRVTRRWLVVSVPYRGVTLGLDLHWGRYRFHTAGLGRRLPAVWLDARACATGEHRWELGMRGFSRKAFRKLLRASFDIRAETFHPTHHHMVFYLCEKGGHHPG